MTAHVQTSALSGLRAHMVTIEVDTSKNLPAIIIVGLPHKSTDEAKERIRSAITNSDLTMPRRRITVNMAPADIPKEGSSYDLAMALGILHASEQIPPGSLKGYTVLGELGLDGAVRPVRGIIGHLSEAKRLGIKKALIPTANLQQASLVEGIDLYPLEHLKQAYLHLCGTATLKPDRADIESAQDDDYGDDFTHIAGQAAAKRAVEIAAAGHHNVLMNGPPGGGKTMLAKAATTILPPLSRAEMVELTQLHSLSGLARDEISARRPFRSPHHSASHIALTGGGTKSTPGEVSLAHTGILFLDEIAEFPRRVLESLRQPLEDRVITVARAAGSVTYPADCMLIATQNPCPCGYKDDPKHECSCTIQQILAYEKRLSGPLLDRIDIHLFVERVEHRRLLRVSSAESSQNIRQRVTKARLIQLERQGTVNARLSNSALKKHAQPEAAAQLLLETAADRLGLSARGFIKTLRVARTIADLDGQAKIAEEHIAEALQYRPALTPLATLG